MELGREKGGIWLVLIMNILTLHFSLPSNAHWKMEKKKKLKIVPFILIFSPPDILVHFDVFSTNTSKQTQRSSWFEAEKQTDHHGHVRSSLRLLSSAARPWRSRSFPRGIQTAPHLWTGGGRFFSRPALQNCVPPSASQGLDERSGPLF